jgi:hypothetical protein
MDFKEFINKIDTITVSSDGEYKMEVDKLITEKVQLFDSPMGGKEKSSPVMCVQQFVGLAV